MFQTNHVFNEHKERIQIGGKPSDEFIMPKLEHSAGRPRIMLLYESEAPSNEVREFIDRLSLMQDIDRVFKIRSNLPIADQLLHVGLDDVSKAKRWTIAQELVGADLVLGSYSTMLYELVQTGVAVGVLKMSSMEAEDLVEDGLAAYINPVSSNLEKELIFASQVSDIELQYRAERLQIKVNIEDTLQSLLSQ